MIRLASMGVIVLAVLFAASCTPATGVRTISPGEGAAVLDIVVVGVEPPVGVVRAALFDSPQGFPGETGGVLRRAEAPASGETVRLSFGDVPPGRYAVSVHHDRDGDGRMPTDRIGRPGEPFGTSNNVRNLFGPPTFKSAAFTVQGGALEIEINLVEREWE